MVSESWIEPEDVADHAAVTGLSQLLHNPITVKLCYILSIIWYLRYMTFR
jgi:hypothetical protein